MLVNQLLNSIAQVILFTLIPLLWRGLLQLENK